MSIIDPILPEFHERKNYWILKRGRETFFDTENYMLVFSSQEEAEKYRDKNLTFPYRTKKPFSREKNTKKRKIKNRKKPLKEKNKKLRLF
jgi:hypothetical protein